VFDGGTLPLATPQVNKNFAIGKNNFSVRVDVRFCPWQASEMARRHCLSIWMNGRISQTAFAEAARISSSHLSLVLSGERRPSYDSAKRMSEVTGGKISVEMIFNDTDRLRAGVAA
jgi:Helix-turn-helix